MSSYILMLLVGTTWTSTEIIFPNQSACTWLIRSQAINETRLKCVKAIHKIEPEKESKK